MDRDRCHYLYLIFGVALFRLVYINFVPVVPQEAYYWNYAKHLALSYFDHPPMTAWTIALCTALGGDNPFCIRLGAVFYSLGVMIIMYAVIRRLLDRSRPALKTVIIVNCSILFSLGSTIMTPDVPLMFFWALILYVLVRLRDLPKAGWWYLAGAALGLGLLSKYSAILIVPGIFLYLLFSPGQRRWLGTVHPYAALCLAAVIFLPVIIWNAQHEWASFLFQSSRRFSEMRPLRLDFFGQLLGSQAGLLTPYIFLLTIVGWFSVGLWGFRRSDDRYRLLFFLALPVYLIFTGASFKSLVKMNWMAPAYITSIIAGVIWLEEGSSGFARGMRRFQKPGLILGLFCVAASHLLPLAPVVPIRRGDTWSGWRELAARVMETKAAMGGTVFIFGQEYKIPSEIAYATPHHEKTHAGEIFGDNGLQYAYWTDCRTLIGQDAIFITSDADRYTDMNRIGRCFSSVAEDSALAIRHGSRLFRTFYIYRCYGYKGPESSGP
jgi:hypothetical protein